MNNLSDHELNRRVAKLLYPLATIYKPKELKCGVCIHHSSDCDPSLPWILNVDYCNNWNDLMPLVVNYKIDLEFSEAGLTATLFEIEATTFDENYDTVKIPQRAIVECLLKVLESLEK